MLEWFRIREHIWLRPLELCCIFVILIILYYSTWNQCEYSHLVDETECNAFVYIIFTIVYTYLTMVWSRLSTVAAPMDPLRLARSTTENTYTVIGEGYAHSTVCIHPSTWYIALLSEVVRNNVVTRVVLWITYLCAADIPPNHCSYVFRVYDWLFHSFRI